MEASELPLSPDGQLYHVHITGQELADDVILVGDPGRVDMFKEYFDTVEYESYNREIHCLTGYYKGHRFTALSTGMGTDNIDIVMTELDAAANIDLSTRLPKENHRTLNIVRIGTSGSLQADIDCGQLVASEYAIGLDGLMNYYDHKPEQFEEKLATQFCRHMQLDDCFAHPYATHCSPMLLQRVGYDMHHGITATAPGFYGPQGRRIRLIPSIANLNERLASFSYKDCKLTNFEMETSAIFGFSTLLGHHALTVCLIIANRPQGTFLNNYHNEMHHTIETVLERLL